MRWLILTFLAVAVAMPISAARASGPSTFSLVSDRGNASVGDLVSVGVWVHPNGESIDTVRAALTFTDELSVEDVTIGTAFPRVSPGNAYDNQEGTLSVGAFVIGSPVTGDSLLATVVFRAVSEGAAQVAVGQESRLISGGEERADASGHTGVGISVARGEEVDVAYEASEDTEPPNPIEPYTPRTRYLAGEDALLEFGTTDDGSGIDHYEVSLNDGPYVEASSPYIIQDLPQGDLFIQVKAVDRSGNERFGKTGIRVYPAGTELEPEDEAARAQEQQRIRDIVSSEAVRPGNGLLITLVSGILIIFVIIGGILRRKRQRVS